MSNSYIMEARKPSKFFIGILLALGLTVTVFTFYYAVFVRSAEVTYSSTDVTPASVIVAEPPSIRHIDTPTPVRAVYMTSYVAGVTDWREDIKSLIDDTELNAIVIDIKDYTGVLLIERAKDIEEYIQELHNTGIYVIGRLSVFQDQRYVKEHPELAVKRKDNGDVWRDRKGITWIDPGSHIAWDYVVDMAKEYYSLGFDEINFDYIRFPSDGDMSNVSYVHAGTSTRAIVMNNFYSYLNQQLRGEGIVISADLFGMTTTNKDDLGIGQVLESALKHFDFVAPMVYPSHYPPQFNGWANPNLVPGKIVAFSMERAVARADELDYMASTTGITASTTSKKLRPWLQDFQYGGHYGEIEIRAQKQAVYDVGLDSWMMWDPAVKYTESALDKEATTSYNISNGQGQ